MFPHAARLRQDPSIVEVAQRVPHRKPVPLLWLAARAALKFDAFGCERRSCRGAGHGAAIETNKGRDCLKIWVVTTCGVDVESGRAEPDQVEGPCHAEMAGVVVGCSGWLFVSPTFGPGLRKGVWNLAAQNPQLGKRPEWLESAGPVRMLKGGLSHVSYAVLEEQSNHGEEEVVCPQGQRI